MAFSTIAEVDAAKQAAIAAKEKQYYESERNAGKSRSQHKAEINAIERNYNVEREKISRQQQIESARKRLAESNLSPAAKAKASKNWNPIEFSKTDIVTLGERYDAAYEMQAEAARQSSITTARSQAVQFRDDVAKTVSTFEKQRDSTGTKVQPVQSATTPTTFAKKKKPQVYTSDYFRDDPNYAAPPSIIGDTVEKSRSAVATFEQTQAQQKDLFGLITSASSAKEAIKIKSQYQRDNPYVGTPQTYLFKGNVRESQGVLIEKKLVSPIKTTETYSKEISPFLVTSPKPIPETTETYSKEISPFLVTSPKSLPEVAQFNNFNTYDDYESGEVQSVFASQPFIGGFLAHGTELYEGVKAIFTGKQTSFEPTLEGAFVSDVISKSKTFIFGSAPVPNQLDPLLKKKQQEEGGYEWIAGSLVGTAVLAGLGGAAIGLRTFGKSLVNIGGKEVTKETAQTAIKVGSKLSGTIEQEVPLSVILNRGKRSRFGESTEILRPEPVIKVKTKEPMGVEVLSKEKILLTVGTESKANPTYLVVGKKKSSIYQSTSKQPEIEKSYEITGVQSSLLEKGRLVSQKKITRPTDIQTVTSKTNPARQTFTKKETTVIETKTFPATKKNVEQVEFARGKELAQYGTRKDVLTKDLTKYPRETVKSVTERPTAKTTLLETKITDSTKGISLQASKGGVRDLAQKETTPFVKSFSKRTSSFEEPTKSSTKTILKKPSSTTDRMRIRIKEKEAIPKSDFKAYAITGISIPVTVRPSSAKEKLVTRSTVNTKSSARSISTQVTPQKTATTQTLIRKPITQQKTDNNKSKTLPRYSLLVSQGQTQKLNTPPKYVTVQKQQTILRRPPRIDPTRTRRAFLPKFNLSFGGVPSSTTKKSKRGKRKEFLGNVPLESIVGIYGKQDEITYGKTKPRKSKKSKLRINRSTIKLF